MKIKSILLALQIIGFCISSNAYTQSLKKDLIGFKTDLYSVLKAETKKEISNIVYDLDKRRKQIEKKNSRRRRNLGADITILIMALEDYKDFLVDTIDNKPSLSNDNCYSSLDILKKLDTLNADSIRRNIDEYGSGIDNFNVELFGVVDTLSTAKRAAMLSAAILMNNTFDTWNVKFLNDYNTIIRKVDDLKAILRELMGEQRHYYTSREKTYQDKMDELQKHIRTLVNDIKRSYRMP